MIAEEEETLCFNCKSKQAPNTLLVNHSQTWLGCETCGEWFHTECVGMSEEDFEAVKDQDWYCEECKKKK